MKRIVTIALAFVAVVAMGRERERFDDGWRFAFGNASDPAKDFGCGTEYFNYLTKAASIHNAGPYSAGFDASGWKEVELPHDWVVDLPFAKEASHSHGYKTVGWKYPETSVGWYRKTFFIPASDDGLCVSLRFDGIFRDSRVWVNGFYLGGEASGYATQVYNISEYLNYGGENVVAVRVDASLEEGWFYEGAGIYRHVWLEKTAPMHVAPFGTFVSSVLEDGAARVNVETTVRNGGLSTHRYFLTQTLLDADGKAVAMTEVKGANLPGKASDVTTTALRVPSPVLWSLENPYLYRLETKVFVDGQEVDCYCTPCGIREVRFDADGGFFLNGSRVQLKGVNMHQDHAGVGSAIPDALQVYRLRELKKYGVNAYRSSHNPMTPEMLDACDRLGILVLEENRLTGVNDEHFRLLERMIRRDRNHPSIILWSVGNEEWGIEWNDKGARITASMREFCHRLDPTRLVTVATSSGPNIVETADVAGYNYMMQNPIDAHRAKYPSRIGVGTEETTGCGTRGIYFDEPGRMASLNRIPDADGTLNRIGRGWKFYSERPWLAGLFFWTGFDYRGEPNPLEFPATGSEFGLLDYCGFPKDEAFYLKSWWTSEPVLHVFPHWNLSGHEGETVSIWVYSNCDEVALSVNGKPLGRKKMEKGGYLSWDAVYKPGKVVATGYRSGKRVMRTEVATTGPASAIAVSVEEGMVCNVSLLDSKGRVVPDACNELTFTVSGPGHILGAGNGDPAFRISERPSSASQSFSLPAFNGHAQVLVKKNGESVTLTVSGSGLAPATVIL